MNNIIDFVKLIIAAIIAKKWLWILFNGSYISCDMHMISVMLMLLLISWLVASHYIRWWYHIWS